MSHELFNVLLVVAMAPFATVASILYGLWFPWRRTREGRAFANVLWSFTALIDASVLYQFVPAFPGKALVTTFVFAGILAGLVQLTYSLARIVLDGCTRRKS